MKFFTVGGAVRDTLLGLTPKDIDYVVVGATEQEMLNLGYSKVGADFPVFLHPETNDEYALARIERKVGDGYHGFSVVADNTVSLADDLFRRDFTINAIAMDSNGIIYDPYNGQKDIENKILRHVSPAFAEDPLRVIRLARFYSRYKFSIACETTELSRNMVEAGDLNQLPHERFWAELTKVFSEENQSGFFEVIKHVNADKFVNFFHDLYGHFHMTQKLSKVCEVAKVVSEKWKDAEARVMFHTALTAEPNSKTILTAPVRIQNLYKNINNVRHMTPATAESIYSVMQAAKTWSQSPDMEDLLFAIDLMQSTGEMLHFSKSRWECLVNKSKEITSEMYIDKFQGKELGAAIKNGRIQAIETQLVNWKNNKE